MAGRDGTGPFGTGAGTGRGLGPCGVNEGIRYGLGARMGSGIRRGQGFNSNAGRGFGMNGGLSKSQKTFLHEEKSMLQERLKDIDKELENL